MAERVFVGDPPVTRTERVRKATWGVMPRSIISTTPELSLFCTLRYVCGAEYTGHYWACFFFFRTMNITLWLLCQNYFRIDLKNCITVNVTLEGTWLTSKAITLKGRALLHRYTMSKLTMLCMVTKKHYYHTTVTENITNGCYKNQ